MHAVVERREEAALGRRLVVGQVRVEVDDEHERVQRQPADGEQRDDNNQHLYHLNTHRDLLTMALLRISFHPVEITRNTPASTLTTTLRIITSRTQRS